MRVEIVRSGGLAGVRIRCRIDTGELAPEEASQVEAALRQLPFGRPAPQASHPDAFQYQITVSDDGTEQSVVVGENEIPDDLRPIVESVIARGDIV